MAEARSLKNIKLDNAYFQRSLGADPCISGIHEKYAYADYPEGFRNRPGKPEDGGALSKFVPQSVYGTDRRKW